MPWNGTAESTTSHVRSPQRSFRVGTPSQERGEHTITRGSMDFRDDRASGCAAVSRGSRRSLGICYPT